MIKRKVTPEDKILAVEAYLRGEQQLHSYITLSTCSYEYENARYVVIGRLK